MKDAKAWDEIDHELEAMEERKPLVTPKPMSSAERRLLGMMNAPELLERE